MVNLTALERITRFIQNDRNIRPMKPWSERYRLIHRKNGYLEKLGKEVKDLLILISGNNVVPMLIDVLTQKELDELTLPKYKDCLRNLTEHYNKTEYKQRHNIIRPLKNARFKYSHVRRLGFAVSRPLWRTCINRTPRKLGGGNSIPKHLENSIRSYLKENSNVASNRMVKNKNPKDENYKELIPVRYLVDNKSELYKTFPFADQVSKTTFFKYLNITNEFKNPYRLTDLCDYCEKGIALRNEIRNIVKNGKYECKEQYNIRDMIDHFKNKGLELSRLLEREDELEDTEYIMQDYTFIKNVIKTLSDYEAILFHKNVAKCQRLAYNSYLQNKQELRNNVLIEVDFKQRIVVGLSPRQISTEYYKLIDRSCLGFGIYYLDENDIIKSINFDIISNDTEQDSLSVVRGFRILRSQDFFKRIERDHYIVWADCGKHFRNKTVLGYLLLELAESKITVNMNFFGDKHGKNGRDCHFSNISKFVEAESLTRQIKNSQDIVDAILKRQNMANQNKKDNLNHEITCAIALDSESDLEYRSNYNAFKTLKILNVESYYNYQTKVNTDKYELHTSILSTLKATIPIKKDEATNALHSNHQVLEPEETFEENVTSLQNLHQKKNRINCAVKKIKYSNQMESEVLFNYFTLEDIIDENPTVHEPERPTYCRDLPGTAKKPACVNCEAICSYSIEQILHPTNSIVQNDINKELKLHKHPKSRNIITQVDQHKRLTHEAARELADHYIFAHHHKEPVFF